MLMRKMTEQQILDWNTIFKPGHPCFLRLDDGSELSTHTRSPAWLLGSGHAVVMVNGKAGGWDIDRVKMAETHYAALNSDTSKPS